jgi:hypothetical protein
VTEAVKVPLRIGILGAARIAPSALVKPAAKNPDVVVAAVATRDAVRANTFARKHGIATAYQSYDALIAASDVDAVYNPLPNGLPAGGHGRPLRPEKCAVRNAVHRQRRRGSRDC